jgi:hypothetical protein
MDDDRYVSTATINLERFRTAGVGPCFFAARQFDQRAQYQRSTETGDPGALDHFVARLTPGTRNHATFWAACRAGEAGIANAETALVQAAMAAGPDAIEATRIVRSGIARGARDGRRGA